MNQPLASISIDVDSVWCYRAIHGLPPVKSSEEPIYRAALARFRALLDEFDVKATLFVVASDIETSTAKADILASFVADGHEVASHSYSHDYRLSLMSAAEIRHDLERAQDIIMNATGAAPVGFRAPGYNMSASLAAAIDEVGLLYSSSIFPCPTYFAARTTALIRYAALGKKSRSLRGDPREFFGCQQMYRPSASALYRKAKGRELSRRYLEIPISTTRLFPWIGTSIAIFPEALTKRFTRAVLRSPHSTVLELHAIDFADGASDGYSADLVEVQPDLRVSIDKKLERLRRVFQQISAKRRMVPLQDIARSRIDLNK